MIAIARNIKISPKKANLVAQLVRQKPVNEALDILKFTPKKAAPLLAKVIKSAASNAEHNFKQTADELIIKEIVVNKGVTLKRSVPISRGRVHPILKFTSHITVSVSPAEAPKAPAPKKKAAKKEETKSEEAKTKKTTKKKETKATDSKDTTKKD